MRERNKRRRWLKPDPPLRQLGDVGQYGGARYDPLGDTRPPPPVERPGLARVTKPVIEKTVFSSQQAASSARYSKPAVESTSQWEEEMTIADSPPMAEKRKRDDDDAFNEVLTRGNGTASMPPSKSTSMCLRFFLNCGSVLIQMCRTQPICS